MSFSVPFASISKYGVVKVGSGLSVTDGVISADAVGTRDVGYFYGANTQTNDNLINDVLMTNTTLSQGINLVDNSKLTVTKSGNYTLSIMVQFSKSSTAGGSAVGFFWLRKNGIDIPDSATDLTTSTVSSGLVGAWTYTLPMLAGDYLQMVWHCTLSNAILIALPAQAGPPIIPAAPSVRMTLLQV